MKQPFRQRRVRRRRDGRDRIVKCPKSRDNARPATKYLVHGGRSAFLRDRLDRRTTVGRAYERRRDELTQHVAGNHPDPIQAELIDQGARLSLLSDIAWHSVITDGVFDDSGAEKPAVGAFRRIASDLRAILAHPALTRSNGPQEAVNIKIEIPQALDPQGYQRTIEAGSYDE